MAPPANVINFLKHAVNATHETFLQRLFDFVGHAVKIAILCQFGEQLVTGFDFIGKTQFQCMSTVPVLTGGYFFQIQVGAVLADRGRPRALLSAWRDPHRC